MTEASYKVSPGESLFDVATAAYGDASFIFQLMADNPVITSIDEALSPGTSLVLEPALSQNRQQRAFEQVSTIGQTTLPVKTPVTVKPGQSLTDLVLEQYGDISYVFQLLADNPSLQNPDEALVTESVVFVDRRLSESRTDRQFEFASEVLPRQESPFKSTTIYQGQSVFDLTLQEYGDIQAAIDLLTDTNTDNIGTWVPPQTGSTIRIRKNRVYDADVTQYYQNRNIRINTGRRSLIEGIGLCSSDGVLLISFDNFILKASDQ